MSKRGYKDVCYLICDVKTDLPLAYCDTYAEVARYFGCCHATVWRLIEQHSILENCYVEKVLL